MAIENANETDLIVDGKKPAGWKTMPYILGNEICERLASYGLTANLWIYLLHVYHMDQVFASNIINNWSAVTTFLPLVGGFVSDAFAGKFWTIVFGSVAALLGMVIMTLSAWIPQCHPSETNPHTTGFQLTILLTGLALVSIGSGGIRPCSIPFGIDQFDLTTEKGRKHSNIYYNWYYTSFTVVLIIAQTLIVYIQNDVSWVLGFGIPTGLMLFSIILFLFGRRLYVYVGAEGSLFTSILQVFVASYKKRGVSDKVHGNGGDGDGVFYDPPLKQNLLTKLPLTKDFRFLNKAAIIMGNELNTDGTPLNPWRLCSIQQVEDVKCLLRIFPIWLSCIIPFLAMVQTGTFTVSLAMKMDRHLTSNFQIPPAGLAVISLLTMGLWIPFYDRILVPALRKFTNHESGITLLQRIGIGNVFSILSLIIAGSIERKRKGLVMKNGVAPMSVMWLAPQLILAGLFEAFNLIGEVEFYNKQFPEYMRSIGTAMLFVSQSGASLLNNFLVNIVHRFTTKNGGTDWLSDDVNVGKFDNFYFLSAMLGIVNFIFFLYCSFQYRYKIDHNPVQG